MPLEEPIHSIPCDYVEGGLVYPARVLYDLRGNVSLELNKEILEIEAMGLGRLATTDEGKFEAIRCLGFPVDLVQAYSQPVIHKVSVGRPALPRECRRYSRGVSMLPAAWKCLEKIAQDLQQPLGRTVEILLEEYIKTH